MTSKTLRFLKFLKIKQEERCRNQQDTCMYHVVYLAYPDSYGMMKFQILLSGMYAMQLSKSKLSVEELVSFVIVLMLMWQMRPKKLKASKYFVRFIWKLETNCDRIGNSP